LNLIEVLKALSHKNRIRIINLLGEKRLCVCELESVMKINQSNASRHLNKLKQSGLIKSTQKAQWVYYYLNEDILKSHPFINEIISNELTEVEICRKDSKRLKNYNRSALSCENLSNNNINLDEL
jgi:ArsR family transcriptional regulator